MPDEPFECVTLAVPKDHFAAAGGETWNVTFAIQRATGERKGTFVVITGGPGYSGIPRPDSYTDYYATGGHRLVRHRLHGPARDRPVGPDPVHEGGGDLLRRRRPGPRSRPSGRPRPPRRRDLRQGLHRRGRGRRGGPAVLRDDPGRRGPRGGPRLPRRRQDGPLRRELRHAVRADLRRGPSRSHRDALRRRPGRPDGRRPDVLRRGGPDGRGHARRDARRLHGRTRPARPTSRRRRPRRLRRPRRPARRAGRSRSTSRPRTGRPHSRQLTIARPRERRVLRTCTRGATGAPPAGHRVGVARRLRAAGEARTTTRSSVDPDTLAPIADPTWSDAVYYAVECQDYAFYPTAGDAGRPARRVGRGRRGRGRQRHCASRRATTATCRACTGRSARTDHRATGPHRRPAVSGRSC